MDKGFCLTPSRAGWGQRVCHNDWSANVAVYMIKLLNASNVTEQPKVGARKGAGQQNSRHSTNERGRKKGEWIGYEMLTIFPWSELKCFCSFAKNKTTTMPRLYLRIPTLHVPMELSGNEFWRSVPPATSSRYHIDTCKNVHYLNVYLVPICPV